MHLHHLLLLLPLPLTTAQSKRGLVFIPNTHHPTDNTIWVRPSSPLTWYYNYQPLPSEAFTSHPQSDFEFVPMLWGPISDTSFLDSVISLLDGGREITHVLTFNEPDGPKQYGGSDIAPSLAAQIWVDNIVPLRARGIKAGLPACTGGEGGIPWLKDFLGNCSSILSSKDGNEGKECEYDFVALHWYGNFEGLASHMGEYAAAFPNTTQWITEYGLDHQDLRPTQDFFNESAEYFDRMDSVARYSYFGSFRASVSNVGPNAAMLNKGGELTDIGSWYLGGSATGVKPLSGMAGRKEIGVEGLGFVVLVLMASYLVL